MITPKLTPEQKAQADDLFARLKADLLALAGGDDDLLFNFRRQMYKGLMYDERGTPLARQRLKKATWQKQEGNCAVCGKELPLEGAEIERLIPSKGFVEGNVKVVHHECGHLDRSASASGK